MSTEANKVPGLARVRQDENRRYVILGQAILALGIGYAFAQTLILIWRAAQWPRWEFFGGVHIAYFITVAIIGGAFVYTMKNVIAQDFANEVVVELRKVSWPNAKEVRQTTLVVIICVVIVALILGGFDLLWSKIIKYMLTRGATS